MVNPANNLSDKPFFTKLGFFTKKGYIFFIFFTLIYDNIYVLIFGKDKLQVILFAIPYIVGMLVIYNIIFFGGRYIFSKIKSLFGIDFTANHKDQDLLTPLLSPLFAEKGFQDFQSYALHRLCKRWITFGAIFVTALIEFIGIWGPFLFFQADEWIENFPELAENGLYYAYLVFRVVPLSLFLLWFMFSVCALLLQIIELIIIFNALGNFSGLSLNKITDFFDSSSIVNEKSDVFFQNSEVVQFSLKRFRRKSKIIPQMFLKLNLGISLGAFITVIMASNYFSNILQEEARNFASSFFFPILSGIMLLNLTVFIFPQWSLHRHLERVKESFLESLSVVTDNMLQYLDFTFTDNLEENEERQLLLSELQALNQIIEQTESFVTWPFDYNQVVTLLIGLIFPFIPLIFEILFIL
ncbi:MAG: hypothetical protein ACXAEU_09580 [Candidatus Hodarchaeales archaeon]|jgi:hypothetical protein